jgi:PKD repeat protein
MNLTKFLLLFCVCLFLGGLPQGASAQKAPERQPFEIAPNQDEPYHFEGNIRVGDLSGLPLAIYNAHYPVAPGTPEQMSAQYLQENRALLGLAYGDLRDLKHHATRSSAAGHTVRYRQQVAGLPLNKAEITININANHEVMFVMNTYRPGIKITDATPSISLIQAKKTAHAHIGSQGPLSYEESWLIADTHNGGTLAYEIAIAARHPLGEWHVFVDAHTGQVFKAVDMASYYCSHEDKQGEEAHSHTCLSAKNRASAQKTYAPMKMMANGTGNVFDPDPLSSAMVNYGTGGYVDNNDANSSDLESQLMSVTLLDIQETGGTYKLAGPYAEIVDFDSPNTGLFTQNSPDFLFNRNDQGFEPVNGYYHIDYSMRYINETLGCDIMPFQYVGGVRYDPHGAGGADNSYYTPGTGRLSFGEGCVDDAEDSDVLHHELGHGIHDCATSGNASASEGLGEGSGDYWAQSYNRGLGNWTAADPQYNWMFNWDGHNECWNGRITNYTASYPSGLTGSIHTDGQIWATCLMGIWDQIGQAQTDKMFLEGLAMTNGGSGQNDAANAVFQAAQNMNYSMGDLTFIYNSFTACGYTLPAFNVPPTAAFAADAHIVCLDDGGTVNFTDLSTGNATSYQWSFPGGNPATSTDPNPVVTYASTGTYDVTLVATNDLGSDEEAVVGYITVVSGEDCPSCVMRTSADVPVNISSSGTPTVSSTLPVSDVGVISDINVEIQGMHTWISDLAISLTSPQGTTVALFSNICFDEDDFNVVLDDEAVNGNLPCPPVGGGSYQPEGSLADFIGESPTGTWTLTIEDGANLDGGELSAWNLEICTSPPPCEITAAATATAESCPTASDGAVSAASSDGIGPFTYTWSDGQTSPDISNLPPGTYTVTITDANGCIGTSEVLVNALPSPAPITVSGNTNSVVETTETYSVTAAAGSSYEWTVTGGTLSGGGNSVDVLWGNGVSGEICVVETNSEGCLGEEACLTVGLMASSTEQIMDLKNLSIRPNPTSGWLLVEATEAPLSIQVHDMVGRRLLTQADNSTSNALDLSSFGNGVYLCRVRFEEGTATQRIVVAR